MSAAPSKANGAPAWLAGGGRLGERMRAFDWTRTPLGAAWQWPQNLRIAVRTCLCSSFPIVIWWGRELTLLYNDAYTAILGNKHPRALGQAGQECWREVWPLVGPMLERVLDEGEPFTADDLQLMVWRHGYFEECFFYFSYSPIYAEDDSVSGVFCPVIETTDKIIGARRLETLRQLAALCRVETVGEACRQAIAVLARNGRDIPFAFLYLLSERGDVASLVGATDGTRESVALPLDQHSEWPLGDALAEHRILENLDGKRLPLGHWSEPARQAYLAPVKLPGSQAARALLVIGISPHKRLDQSYRSFLELLVAQVASTIADTLAYEGERKRAEALAELDRAKTAFFANVSHEFRTPLTLMLGPLEKALSCREQLSVGLREELAIAHRNSLRLLKLVNTLLDFSRIEAGRVQACYEPTDLGGLTVELASNFRSAIERAGMRLEIDCAPLPEPVWIDREMWEKIVFNLLSNAFKFTFEGEIAVRLAPAGAEQVRLEVSDTGIGVPAADLPHLFERFHRIRGVRARSHEGSGIGLALVQELVRLHAGSIEVQSVSGQGTTFTICLPLGCAHLPKDRLAVSKDRPSTAIGAASFVEEALRWLPDASPDTGPAPVAAEPGPPAEHARYRILVADDNADMRDYVRRLLESEHDVQTVSDGAAALSAARERAPDLVLADIMMPALDGLGLLRSLRADSATSQIPVVLLSARAGEDSRVEGIDAGADDYLVKPFAARELLARVRTHLKLAAERRSSAQQLNCRVLELERANADARAARRATLNVLEDAVEARDRATRLYEELEQNANWLLGQSKALDAAVNGASLETSLGFLARTATAALGERSAAGFYLAHRGTTLRHVVGMAAGFATAFDEQQIDAALVPSWPGDTAPSLETSGPADGGAWLRLAERFGYSDCHTFPINSASGRCIGALAICTPEKLESTRQLRQLAALLTNTASIIVSRVREAELRQQSESALRESESRPERAAEMASPPQARH